MPFSYHGGEARAEAVVHSLSIRCEVSTVRGQGFCETCHPHPSKTQVSLVPPPWLELTTSEPFLSATRVKPPGTIWVRSRPVSTNGRKSTWRGATPSSTQVGHVDSASVGCATKFLGLDLSLTRKAAMVALSAAGPISMP